MRGEKKGETEAEKKPKKKMKRKSEAFHLKKKIIIMPFSLSAVNLRYLPSVRQYPTLQAASFPVTGVKEESAEGKKNAAEGGKRKMEYAANLLLLLLLLGRQTAAGLQSQPVFTSICPPRPFRLGPNLISHGSA